jgi:methylphosphotriester-DNA--protein-cysteine methyltransferase
VLTGEATWVLPPTRALWIPVGLPHETASDGRATMRSPASRSAGWLGRVGYDTPSAFVAAFRREMGQTPGSFFRP